MQCKRLTLQNANGKNYLSKLNNCKQRKADKSKRFSVSKNVLMTAKNSWQKHKNS